MFILSWYRDYLDIKAEYKAKQRELQFCDSCEALKLQLAVVNEEKKFLLEKVLDKDKPEPETAKEPARLTPIMPNRMSFGVRRQMLEQESRAAAKVLANNAIKEVKPRDESKPLTIKDIEDEIGVENG